MNQVDRDAIDDRGLVDDDHTEEMRKPRAATTRGLQFENPTHHQMQGEVQ